MGEIVVRYADGKLLVRRQGKELRPWLSVREVSERTEEPERTIRYRCEKGVYPAVKTLEGDWRISPALFGEYGGILREDVPSEYCVVPLGVPGDELYIEHPLRGPVFSWFQLASGTPEVVVSRAESGRAWVAPLGDTSGRFGYLWLTRK